MNRVLASLLKGIICATLLSLPFLILAISGFYTDELVISQKHSLVFQFYSVYYGGLFGIFVAFLVARYQIKRHISYEKELKENSEKEFEKWFLHTYLKSFISEIKEVLIRLKKEDIELSLSEFNFDYVSNHYIFIKELESWNPIDKIIISDILKSINKLQTLQNLLIHYDNKRNNIIIECTLNGFSKIKANELINQLDRLKHDKINLFEKISMIIIDKYDQCIKRKIDIAED